MAPLQFTAESRSREIIKLLLYMVGAALFFGITLLVSFFLVILASNITNISSNVTPNIFMLGLAPPSIGTFFLFTKIFGRFI